jgi:pimeloyl-ACP methyl ester carboxylesterase
MTVPLAAPLTHSEESGRLTTVILSTGITPQYADGGPADSQVVLFLHSYPDSWYSCSRVLPPLPDGIRAVTPTRLGQGDAKGSDCCYRTVDFAADAVAAQEGSGNVH